MLYHGVTLAYCPFIDRLPEPAEVQPSVFVAVPRVYEKIYAQAERRKPRDYLSARSSTGRFSVGATQQAKSSQVRTPSSPIWKLANKLVFSKIREGMGGQVETFISGGLPWGANWRSGTRP